MNVCFRPIGDTISARVMDIMDRFAAYRGFAPRGAPHLVSRAFALGATALLAACGSTSGGTAFSGGTGYGGAKPVSLVKSFGTQDATVQKVALNSGAIAKAVERYRINKKSDPSPYTKVGVDLNGDGQAEALVYLTGEKWCAKTGCTLAVFRSGQFGYRAVSTIRRVKLPIRVASGENQGWRNLIVNTGGVAGLPMQTVLLQFTGHGYPGNATTLAPIPQGVQVPGTTVIEAPSAASETMGDAGVSKATNSTQSTQAQPLSLNP